MIHHRPIVKTFIFSILLSTLVSLANMGYAQGGAAAGDAAKGKALFTTNCASCHNPIKQITGPALKGVTGRVPDKKLLHDWIKNNQKVLAAGNPYFTKLYNDFSKTPMNTFPGLSDADIDDILKYVETYQAPSTTPGGDGVTPKTEESDNTLLYGILTLILAVIMFVLLQVNSSLKKLSDDKEGIPAQEPIPFYRNKVYITFVILILFVLGGFWVVQGAIGLGRQQNYQPEQPIFYSHKVHAGINQVSCLYCHGNAWDSKHATVPSLNVCMNCHAAINEYSKGPKLYREDGSEVDGTAEIAKLYKHVGYDAKTGKYDTNAASPVEWTKIHNLPDHVYFNHSQHIRVGKVQCQTCHGPIQEMDEVKQFSALSMGWCINCHRTTKVNFGDSTGNGNKFYSVYEKFHQDLKNHDKDSITVENIGGTECQKCHY